MHSNEDGFFFNFTRNFRLTRYSIFSSGKLTVQCSIQTVLNNKLNWIARQSYPHCIPEPSRSTDFTSISLPAIHPLRKNTSLVFKLSDCVFLHWRDRTFRKPLNSVVVPRSIPSLLFFKTIIIISIQTYVFYPPCMRSYCCCGRSDSYKKLINPWRYSPEEPDRLKRLLPDDSTGDLVVSKVLIPQP